MEINEPDNQVSEIERKDESELKTDILAMWSDHERNTDEIGQRFYWLKKKLKARKCRKGEGFKAWVEANKLDLNHVNYLIRKYEPEDEKVKRQAKSEEKRQDKLEQILYPQNWDEEQLIEIPISNTPATMLEAQKFVMRCLVGLSKAKQIDWLCELGNWLAELVDDRERPSPAAAALKGQYEGRI